MDLLGNLRRVLGLGPPRLTIELVPKPCWGRNVRALVSPEVWRGIQGVVFRDGAGRCQVCGWPAAPIAYRPQFECHETWRYDDWRGVQTLEGFVALCRFCHEVKHIGLTQSKGRYAAAIAHLATVNGWSRKAARRYADECVDTYERRSRRTWTQDLSVLYEWLERQGIPSQGPR
jgi:hypothetical protein